MPIYSVKAPNGKIYDVEGPEDADPNTLFAFVQQQVEAEELKRRQKEFGPGVLGTLGRGVERGLGQLGSTLTDVIPAMVGSTLGFDEYAQEQLAEAEQKQRAREAAAPTLFPSYKDVEGIGDVPRFVAEVVGEQIPNLAASLIPGLGVGAGAGRVIATGAAKQLAERAAQRGLTGEAAEEFVKRGLSKLTPQVARATGTATDAGVFLGAYALNAPEVFQNIYEETGELAPGAGAIAGAAAAALDSILPASLARQISGPVKVGVVEKVLERSGMDRGLARSVTASVIKGAPAEGLTEAAQEAISIAAERFIDDNPEVFGSKEWDRLMNSAVKGAIGGGAFSALGGAAEAGRAGAERRAQYQDALARRQDRLAAAADRRQAAELEALQQIPDQMSLPGMEPPIASGLAKPLSEADLLKPKTPPAKLKEPKGVQQQMFTAEGALTPAMEKAAAADEKKEAKKQEIIARQQAQKEKAEAKEAQNRLKQLLNAKQMEFPGFDLETMEAQRKQEEAQRKADEEVGQGDLFRAPPPPPTDTRPFDEIRGTPVQRELPGMEAPIASGLAQPRTEADLLAPATKQPKLKEPKGKQQEMFTAEGEPTKTALKTGKAAPPTPPTLDTITKIDDPKAFGRLINVGPTALILRGDGPLAGKDISDPEQAAEVKQTLEAYASGKPATGAAEKIETFLQRPEFQGVPYAGGFDVTPSGAGAEVVSEPGGEPTTEPTGESQPPGMALVTTTPDRIDEGEKTAFTPVGSLDLRGLLDQPETTAPEQPVQRLNMEFVAEARDEYNRTKNRRDPNWNKLPPEEKEQWLDTYEQSGDALRPRYLSDESRTIEGEVREVPPAPAQLTNEPSEVTSQAQEEMEEELHSRLTREEKRTLAAHYGQKTYNKKAKAAFINDLVQAVNEGIDTVSEAIHSILKRFVSAILTAAIIFNANVFTQNDVIAAPAQVANMKADGYVLKAAPDKVAAKMSSAAQVAYAVMAPVMEQSANGKLWTIFDKPNAYTFVFNPDGSLFYEGKTLTGKTVGDQLNDAGLSVNQLTDKNKITPAGVFTLELVPDAEYDGGRVFQLQETRNYNKVSDTSTYVAWHSAYTAGKDGEARRKALADLNPGNGRYSYGCLNANKTAFLNKIIPNASRLDGAPVFVVPDNQAAVMDYMQNTVQRTDYATPKAVQPLERYVADGVRNAAAASAPAYTRQLVGRAEKTFTKPKFKQPAVTQKITDQQIADIVEDFGERHYKKTGKRLFLPKFVGASFNARNAQLAKDGNLNALITDMINQTDNPSIKKVLAKIRALNLKTKIVIGKPEGLLGLTVERRIDLLKNPAFVEWFGDSKIYETRTVFGKTARVPTVMYHGTSRNIKRFQPKQAQAIFLSPDPDFSKDFAKTSQKYVFKEILSGLTKQEQIEYLGQAIQNVLARLPNAQRLSGYDERLLSTIFEGFKKSKKNLVDYTISYNGVYEELQNLIPLPSYQNIVPVYVRAENPFDFKDAAHVNKIANALPREVLDSLSYLDIYSKKDLTEKLKQGDWPLIESSEIQQAIRESNFDSFYVYEGGVKNLAVYESSQTKSAVSSRFSVDDPRLRYAEDKAGSYDPATDTITLDPKNGMNAHTFIHELVHAAISNVLDKKDHPLTKEFEKFFISIRDRLGPAYGAQDLQEFAAELVGNPEFQALLKSIKTPRSKSLFTRIMQAIARFFGFAPGTNAFDQGLKFVNDAIDITGDVEVPAAQKMFLGMGNFPAVGQIGRTMPAATASAIDNAKNLISNLQGYGLKEMAFGLLRLDNLNQMYGKQLPAIQKLLDALELRNGKQERMIKDINEKYKKFVGIQNKHPQAMEKLNDIAIDARIAAVDLLDPNFQPSSGNLAEYNRLKAAFDPLPADVKNLYRTIRADYDSSFFAYQKILEEAARKVSPSLAVRLAQEFQTRKPQIGYIPFLRQGKFWIEYVDPANNEPVVSSFESIRERQQFIDQMLTPNRIQYKNYQNVEDLRFSGENLPPSSFIMQVMNGLRKQNASQAQLNGVYQAYLATFPAESLMKQFMKSKNRRGMEKDIVRGYGDLMIRWARKLSNAEYIPQIDNAVNEIQYQAQQYGDDPTLTAVAQNITNQANFFHNPNFGTFTQTATALSYFEYIAGNISSALINISSLPMLVWPMLTGKYGWADASNAMRNAGRVAMNDWKKDPRYKKLYDTLMDHAQLEHTLAREILEGRRQSTSEYLGIKARVLDGLSIPFAATEKYNRAVTAIAAYDLEFARTKNQDAAVRYALNTVKDVHTSGLAATGPRWMQTPLGRMFFTFKSFIWNSAYIMARAFHQSFKGETPEVRRAAQRQLLATYGMATVFAGMKGMPFYGAISVLATMINALFGDDEPFDFDEFMRSIFGEFFYKGAFNYATNLELANRAGIATDLIFRDDPRGIAEHGYVLSALIQAVGPLGTIGVNTERGISLMNEGETERGIEMILPSFAKNFMKGSRYLVEGATTIKGDPIMEDIGAYNSLMQMIGFAPADLSSQYERVQAGKAYEREIRTERTRLLTLHDMAKRSGDTELEDQVREDIDAFNDRHPEKKITRDTLKKSEAARRAAEQEMIAGVRFDKDLKPDIEELFFEPYE